MPGNKIDKQCKDEVVRWLALGDSVNTVLMKLERDYSIKVLYQNIYNNYLNHPKIKKRIQDLRDKWVEELDKIAISNKAVRLQKLQEALDKSLNTARKRCIYDREGNLEEEIYDHHLAPVASLIREARAEVEGDPTVGKGTQIGMVQIIKNVNQVAQAKFKEMKNSKDENVRNRLNGADNLEQAIDSGSFSLDLSDLGDITIL